MAVLTFSRTFPGYHPKAGQPTHFPEAILTQLGIDYSSHDYFLLLLKLNPKRTELELDAFYKSLSVDIVPKGHTIRAGSRWEVLNKFSPRVWSGKPYQTKQIQFAPDIEIKKIWDVRISFSGAYIYAEKPIDENSGYLIPVGELAKNDGLEYSDFESWFKIHPKKKNQKFSGQIICWNENISY